MCFGVFLRFGCGFVEIDSGWVDFFVGFDAGFVWGLRLCFCNTVVISYHVTIDLSNNERTAIWI